MRRSARFAFFGWLVLSPLSLAAEPAPAEIEAPSTGVVTTGEAVSVSEPATASQTDGDAKPVDTEVVSEPAVPAEPTLLININLTTQRMVVTENGAAKYTWAVSSGAYGYPTPTGTFRPSWMSQMWYSKQYDNAPMPHSIFFKGGAAIHATSSIYLLGTPASHGCVRLSPSNAARLYGLVSRHGKDRTEITVHGRPKYAPQVAQMRPMGPRYPTRLRYAYSPYGYAPGYSSYGAPPRYAYPGDGPRYYVKTNKQRAAAMKKRRAAVRQYYSAY